MNSEYCTYTSTVTIKSYEAESNVFRITTVINIIHHNRVELTLQRGSDIINVFNQ